MLAISDPLAEVLQYFGAPPIILLFKIYHATDSPVKVVSVEHGLEVYAALVGTGALQPIRDALGVLRFARINRQPHVGKVAVPEARPRAVHHFRAQHPRRRLGPALRDLLAVLLDRRLAAADLVAELERGYGCDRMWSDLLGFFGL